MAPIPYIKPHLTYAEQLVLLKERGLTVQDDATALWYLETLGYYRLSGYFYPFRTPTNPVIVDGTLQRQPRLSSFIAGATFEQIVALYKFDNALRLLSLDAIEKLEVAARSKIAYHLCAQEGCAHLNPELMNPKFVVVPSRGEHEAAHPSNYEVWLEQHNKLLQRSKEDFIKHFREKYIPPIPLWVSIEVWDFGLLSYFYAGLNDKDKLAIAQMYGLNRFVLLASWLRSISHLRNICAHHSRLWNRALTDNPKPPGKGELPELEHLVGERNVHARDHVYGTFAVMQFVLKQAGFGNSWAEKLKGLLRNFPGAAPVASLHTMGFPENWDQLPLWN